MDKEIAIKNLVDIRDTLNDLNIRYFLIDGTLLGFTRDNDFIEHDSDTDMGVFFSDFTQDILIQLKDVLSSKGFKLEHQLGDYDNNFELSFTRDDIKTDLFFYRELGDNMIFHAFKGSDVITYYYPKEWINDLSQLYCRDILFNVPAKRFDILRFKYGDNWETPDKEWDWAYGPRNILNKPPIVFTCGCFDLLHNGHINLFNEMKKIVGLDGWDNSLFYVLLHDDLSILKNKGKLPIQKYDHREYNLKLIGIDHIVEVKNRSPKYEIKEFLKKFNGNQFVYVRGDDWLDFPGREVLHENGVPIVYVKYTDSVSSSAIRKEIQNG